MIAFFCTDDPAVITVVPSMHARTQRKKRPLPLGPSFSAGTGAVFVVSLFSFRFLGVNRPPDKPQEGWSPVHPSNSLLWKEGWVPAKVRPPMGTPFSM